MSAKLEIRGLRRLAPALLLGLLVAGCGSPQSVSLGAHIDGAKLSVTAATLGTQLGGGFTLVLSLGNYASKGTQVTVQSFSVVGASSNATLVDPLPIGPDPGTIDVGVGKTKNVVFKVDGSTKLLPAGAKTQLCAGKVVIVGTVTDTLGGGKSIPLRSSQITVSGC